MTGAVLERPPVRAPEHDLAAALAAAEAGDTSTAIAGLRQAARDRQGWDEPHLRLAELHRRHGDLAAAQQGYRAALGCNPDRPEALLALGAMLVSAGNPIEAAPLLQRCCRLTPADARAHHARGVSAMLLGRHDDALDALLTSHAFDPADALCAVHLADAAQALGCLDRIAAMFQRGFDQDPWNAAMLTGRAAVLAHRGQRDAAIDALEAATLLNPQGRVAAAMLGDMLARTTRQTEAETALRHARSLDADNFDTAMALSVVLMRLHRHRDAVTLLEGLLPRIPNRVGPLCNLATALVALGRQQDALDHAQQAIALAPDHPAPHRALCNALPYSPAVTGAALLRAAQACAARHVRAVLPPHANTADPDRRLKLGLLSGTLRTHPVGWLTIAGIEQLDPAAFDLVCLTPNAPEDAIGRRFAAIASWEDTGSLDDRQLADRARGLGIDILIDLGGYGDFGRMPALAHRLAPVQIKWVGMQNHSTGLAEMDWFITDRWETPPELSDLYSERLLILPDGYVCYAPPTDAPPVAPPPALRHGYVTFGCYNNLAKITPGVVAAWAQILQRAPTARLILKTHQFNDAALCQDLLSGFAAHGIASGRITLRGSSPHRALLAQYADIDIVLDPFPYSGGLTTCEALWMGVPTLTFPGETFASRHSASHMNNVGLPHWVVADLAAYIDAAAALAAAPPALAALRAGLREQMRRSPLCDAPRFGRALAAALRSTWQDWCASVGARQPATPFTLP